MSINKFLDLLWPTSIDEARLTISYMTPPNAWGDTEHISLHEKGRVVDKAAEWTSKNKHVFIGTCARKPGLINRGGKNDLVGIPGLWADVDIYNKFSHKSDNLPPDSETAFKLIDQLNLPPTLVVDSGYGFHLWWLFRDPVWFKSSNDLDRFEKLNRALEANLRVIFESEGYSLDKTSDLARVLRLPDTLNVKDPEHPRPATVWCDDGPRYTVEELEARFLNGKIKLTKFWPDSCDIVVDRLQKVNAKDSKEIIKRVFNKEPLAAETRRDNTIQSICYTIANCSRGLPVTEHPEEMVEILRPSIEAMMAAAHNFDNPPPTMDTALEKMTRALANVHAEWEIEEKKNCEIQEALARKIRSDSPDPVYTEDEIKEYTKAQDTTLEGLYDRLIIQKGSAYYIFFEGEYVGPRVKEELANCLHKYLAPMPGIRLQTLNKDGNMRDRTVAELLKDYCTVVDDVVVSLPLQKSYYDASIGTFYEAACPLTNLSAEYNPQIDQWLHLLGGAEAEKLLDWLATITILEKPSCALYLSGARSTGKSMLTLGIAGLWNSVPTEISRVTDNFNDDLTRCPLVVADEHIPFHNGKKNTGELRDLVAKYSRTLSRKYVPNMELQGTIRLFICANNDELLNMEEDLGQEDLRAVAERFLHIRVDDSAANYLKSLGGAKGTSDWVMGKRIAKHLVWLKENRKVDHGARFIVEGKPTHMHRTLAMQGTISNLVLEWLARYLTTSTKNVHLKVICGNGTLAVNADIVKRGWEELLHDMRIPSIKRIGAALKRIAKSEIRVGGIRHHVVDLDMLMTWMVENQMGNEELILAKINAPVILDTTGEMIQTVFN